MGEELKRVDLLTSRDIRNIKKSYVVDSQASKQNSDNPYAVNLWIKECESLKDNPILFYKNQNEDHEILQTDDFCLIIMNASQKQMIKKFPHVIAVHGTQGVNGNDFEMTTVTVIDEFQHGFPVAFMFSNRKDTEIQTLFFSKIEAAVGALNGRILMTDMTEYYHEAWNTIMGDSWEHLFIPWHVDRAWKNNLTTISDGETRDRVYNILTDLQQETCVDSFIQSLNKLIVYLYSDQNTKKFAKYFKKTFSYNYEKWASCFREISEIDMSAYLESIHKVIKYFYLKRTKVKSSDKSLHIIMQYVKSKSIERVIRITGGDTSEISRNISNAHSSAVRNSNNYTVVEYKNYWQLIKDGRFYNKVERISNVHCCQEICSHCKVCSHMYTCSCEFYMKTKDICEHIHIVLDKSTISQDPTDPFSQEHRIKELITKLSEIDYQELDESIRDQISAHLLIILNLANHPSFDDDDELHLEGNCSKKNANQQARVSSSKRKRTEEDTPKQQILKIKE